jgi:hypothetical protein
MIDAAFSSEVGTGSRSENASKQTREPAAITFEIISLDMSVPQNPIRHIQEAGIRVASRPPG